MKVKSKRALARALGKSEATIRKWAKDPRWSLGVGPWEVARVKAWAARTLAPDAGEATRPARKTPAASATKSVASEPAAPQPPPPTPIPPAASISQPPLPGLEAFDPIEERRANVALKRRREEMLAFEIEQLRRQHVKIADVKSRWQRIAHEVKTELLNLAEAIVPALQGLSEIEQRDVLRGRITELLRHLAGSGVEDGGGAG